MTRKDYVRIAAAIRKAFDYVNEADSLTADEAAAAVDGVSAAISFIANALLDDNPRFDRTRFIEACTDNGRVYCQG